MCGRFSLDTTLEDLYIALKIKTRINIAARYNIAPGQPILVLRNHPVRVAREYQHLGWGLIPGWMKQAPTTGTMINARAETVAEKPTFRSALQHRRCLIPADGYYEWKSMQGRKQPYYFHLKDGTPFCFAGLWERWQPTEGEPVQSCAIITTGANALGADIHHRMPVILPRDDYARWLAPGITAPSEVLPLLQPYPPEAMSVYPVSTLVNNARVDEPRCITPLADPL